MVNSCNKGKVGEREFAAFLSERGWAARRGQQHKGGGDSPDVTCEALTAAGFHPEVKRVETLSLYKAMEQATRDAGDRVPLVAHRRNRKPWLIVLHAEDFLKLLDRVTLAEIGVTDAGSNG